MPTAWITAIKQAAVEGTPTKARSQHWTSYFRPYTVPAAHRTRQLKRRWPSYLGATVGFATWTIYTYRKSEEEEQGLNPTRFTTFILASKDVVSSTSSIFTLKPIGQKEPVNNYKKAWRKGIWSIQIKQPQLQIARAYTPLPPIQTSNDSKNDDLRFLIRRDPEGEVSGYLHRLPIDATIEVRGPHLEYETPQDIEEIVFLAGGTGIAPALQVAHSLLDSRVTSSDRTPKIHILWACRKREDSRGGIDKPLHISTKTTNSWNNLLSHFRNSTPKADIFQVSCRTPIVRDLDSLVELHDKQFGIEYYVDEEKHNITKSILERYLQTQDHDTAESQLKPSISSSSKKMVIISGPGGFVNYFAGPKAWHEGQHVQGRLGGILKDIKPIGWEVWKL